MSDKKSETVDEGESKDLHKNKTFPQNFLKKETNMAPKTDMVYVDASGDSKTFQANREASQNEEAIAAFKRKIIQRFSYKNSELVKKIYKENRAKARASHAKFFHLNYDQKKTSLPLYNQPSELKVYQENKKSFELFRPRLLKFLQLKKKAENDMDLKRHNSYEDNRQLWIKKIEKVENNPKRKQRQQRIRQFYEREFPEIKKHREQQERFERLGSRNVGFVRSEAEMDEITDNLREIDASEKQMRLLAIETPYLMSTYNRRSKYINQNGLIRDLEAFEKERKTYIVWTENERKIYREKYFQFPKDFEKIASFLPLKSCSDCVLYYYRNKKKEGFRSSKSKPKKRNKLNRAVTGGGGGNTMQLRMDKQKPKQNKEIQEQTEIEEEEAGDDSMASEEETNSVVVAEVTTSTSQNTNMTTQKLSSVISSHSNTATTSSNNQEGNESTQADNISQANAAQINATVKNKSTTPVKVFNTRSGKYNQRNQTQKSEKTSEEIVTTSVATTAEPSHPPLKMTLMVTSPSHVKDNVNVTSVVSIISETITSSSMAPPEQSNADASKKAQPVVTSTEQDATSASVVSVVDELIKQHLSKMPEHSDPSRWSEQEMMKAVEGLKRHGRCWSLISKLVETKSEAQCKNFYFNYKKKFNLESILGICKKEGASMENIEEREEELIQYLEELEREEEMEKKKKKDKKPSTPNMEVKQDEKPREQQQQPLVFQTPSVIKTTPKEESNQHGTSVIEEAPQKPIFSTTPIVSTTPSVLKKTENVQPISRKPPPLVSDPQVSKSPKMKEISLKDDVHIFKQKLKLSIDNDKLILQPAPPLVPADSLQYSPCEEMTPKTPTIPERFKNSAADTLFLSQQEKLRSQQAVANQYNKYMSSPKNLSEQNAAIKAFNTIRPRFMSSLPHAALTPPADSASTRFRFPVSPSLPTKPPSHAAVTPQKSAFSFNQQQSKPLSKDMINTMQLNQHAQFHASQISPRPPSMSGMTNFKDHRFAESPIIPPKKKMTLDEQKRLEYEYFQRKNAVELEQHARAQQNAPDLYLQREIEAERKAKILQQQKELEIQKIMHHEAQRQEEMQNYMHLKSFEKLHNFRLQQESEERKQARIREFEKKKEFELMRQNPFYAELAQQQQQQQMRSKQLLNTHQRDRNQLSENTLNERPSSKMSNEMIMSLHKHFSPFENLWKHDNLSPTDPMQHALNERSLEFARDLKREASSRTGSPHPETYLRTYPHQMKAKSFSELQQRAASIPDLRTDIPRSIPDSMHSMNISKDNMRAGGESYQDKRTSIGFPMEHKFNEFGKPVNIHEIPMEPLSRPGSTDIDMQGFQDKKVYGISTGLARQSAPLGSITGYAQQMHEFSENSLSRGKSPHYDVLRSNALVNENEKRKKVIVRPWEIPNTQGKQELLTRQNISSPVPSNIPPLQPGSRQGTPQPVIHLAPTTSKYKKEIINIAQMSSPAPEAFPKFNFDIESVKEHSTGHQQNASSVITATQKNLQLDEEMSVKPQARTIRSLSELSISPTYDFSGNELIQRPSFPTQNNDRRISPSLTVPSSENSDVRHSRHLMDRLRQDNQGDVFSERKEQNESFVSNITDCNSSLLVKRLLSKDSTTSPDASPKTSYVSTSLYIVENPKQFSASGQSNTKVKTVTVFPEAPPLRTEIDARDNSQNTSVPTNDKSTNNAETVNAPQDKLKLSTKSSEEEIDVGKVESNPTIPQELQNISKGIVVDSVKSDVIDEPQNGDDKENISKESPQAVEKTTTFSPKDTVPDNSKDIKPISDDSKSVENPPLERPESPDIYDDLKVHDYDEQPTDAGFEIFKTSNSNETLSKLTSGKSSPLTTDLEIFYDKRKDSETEPQPSDNTSEKEEGEIDDDDDDDIPISLSENLSKQNNIPVPTIQVEGEETKGSDEAMLDKQRKDAGTPVMDEPCLEKDTPEQKSPNRLRPPEHRFNVDKTIRDIRSESRRGVRDKFESITPPRSPGSKRKHSDIDSVPTNQNRNDGNSVAFPFSALAFSVSSRSSSRTSISHSDARSHRSNEENHPKSSEYRHDYQSDKRPAKRRYHRSNSRDYAQIKSPEYEHRFKKHYHGNSPRHSPHYSPRQSPRESPRYSPRHSPRYSPRYSPRHTHSPEWKRRKSSSSPDNDTNFNRRIHPNY